MLVKGLAPAYITSSCTHFDTFELFVVFLFRKIYHLHYRVYKSCTLSFYSNTPDSNDSDKDVKNIRQKCSRVRKMQRLRSLANMTVDNM